MTRMKIFLALTILLALVSGACALPGLTTTPQESNDRVGTAAAATADAILTQQVVETVIAYLTATPDAPRAEAQMPPTITLAPSSTPLLPTASSTPLPPTNTPLPATGTVAPCNMARFVGDVTVPDGSGYDPGEEFTKIWRLKNVGSCIWTSDFSLAFDRGDQMGGPTFKPINQNVLPGETIDVSVDLTAPEGVGEYTGYWNLRTDVGVLFGIGPNATKSFYVQIVVEGPGSDAGVMTSFTSSYCSAKWTTGKANPLACPSTESENGAVWRAGNPKLEGGYQDDEAAIVVVPSSGDEGYVQGTFPSFKVGSDSHFEAVIGCMDNSDACDVTFKVNYIIEGGEAQNLGSWSQVSDNKFQSIKVDLSSLAGKTIKLILRVNNNGDSEDDRAFWLAPRITD